MKGQTSQDSVMFHWGFEPPKSKPLSDDFSNANFVDIPSKCPASLKHNPTEINKYLNMIPIQIHTLNTLCNCAYIYENPYK